MTEQQILDQSAPPAPPAPRRTIGLRLLIGSAVGAFVLGIRVGGGFGALIGYVAHPDATDERPVFQQQDLPQRPGLSSNS